MVCAKYSQKELVTWHLDNVSLKQLGKLVRSRTNGVLPLKEVHVWGSGIPSIDLLSWCLLYKHSLTSSRLMPERHLMHFISMTVQLYSGRPFLAHDVHQSQHSVFLPARLQIGGDSFRRGRPLKAGAGVSTTGLHDVLWLWFTWQRADLWLNQHVSHAPSHPFLSGFLRLCLRGVYVCLFDTNSSLTMNNFFFFFFNDIIVSSLTLC